MAEKTIRVLQVTGGLGQGGLETVAMNIVRYLDNKKYSFDFLVYGDKNHYHEKEAVERGCKIIRFNRSDRIHTYFRQLLEVFRENGPYDVVISHTFMNSGIVLKAAKKCGIKTCVAYAHSSKRGRESAKQAITYRLLRSWINRYSDLRIACSQPAGEYVYGRGRNFHIIGNGIDVEAFRFNEEARKKYREELGIKDELVLGTVGRLSPEKNQLFLVHVLKKLRDMGTNAVLLLVGEGNARKGIEQEVQKNGLQSHVILTGARSDVPGLLAAMDVFLFPSLHEGLGICAIEAQASGLRTICSDRIPKEVALTDLVSFLPLNDGAVTWAETIKSVGMVSEREKYFSIIAEKGYSIEKCMNDLEKFLCWHFRFNRENALVDVQEVK